MWIDFGAIAPILTLPALRRGDQQLASQMSVLLHLECQLAVALVREEKAQNGADHIAQTPVIMEVLVAALGERGRARRGEKQQAGDARGQSQLVQFGFHRQDLVPSTLPPTQESMASLEQRQCGPGS